MKTLTNALVVLFFALVAGVYAGFGWITAWILDAGFSLDVNYSIFIWVSVGLFLISVLPLAIRGK